MANMAFRLFKFTPYVSTPQSLGNIATKVGKLGTRDYIDSWLKSNKKRIFMDKLEPDIDAPAILSQRAAKTKPNKGDPCFYVDFHKRVHKKDKNVIEVVLYKGSFGDLDTLVKTGTSSGNTFESIENDAATRKFLVRIGFPSTSSECYVAAQMRANTQAGTDLFNRITYEARLAACSPKGSQEWYAWQPTPLIDGDRFLDATKNAEVTKINLVKKSRKSNGSPAGNKFTLTLTRLSDQQKEESSNTLSRWAQWFSSSKSNTSKPSGTHDVAALFPAGYVTNLADWDMGQIVFKENGKETTISADKLKDLVVYPLGDKATEKEMWAAADNALSIIAKAEKWSIPRLI